MTPEAAAGALSVARSGLAAQVPAAWNWEVLAGRALQVAVILAAAWFTYRGVVVLTRRFERKVEAEEPEDLLTPRRQRAQTVGQVTRYVALVGLGILALLMVLNLFVPITGLLAGVGFASLALGFGAQTLVRDVIAGIFILAEGQYGVGDVIRINRETAGQVQNMTLRVVVLRDVEGIVHTIPNGEITQVANLTKEWSRALLHVGVAYGEDVDRVIAVLEEIGREMWEDEEWGELILEEPVVPGVERFDESAVVIRVMAKTLPLKQWDVMREMRRRIKKRFDREGIEIPFPHRTLYWGRQGRPSAEGAAPPLEEQRATPGNGDSSAE